MSISDTTADTMKCWQGDDEACKRAKAAQINDYVKCMQGDKDACDRALAAEGRGNTQDAASGATFQQKPDLLQRVEAQQNPDVFHTDDLQQGGDASDDKSTSTVAILGVATLAALGIWWMMGPRK